MATKDVKGEGIKNRDEKGRYVSPVNGQPVPEGKVFVAGDSRAKEAQRKSAEARKKNGDLRKLCRMWMEEDVATDAGGERITGGEMMVRVAVKELLKGNPRFWELMRDTAGYKPVENVAIQANDFDALNDAFAALQGDSGE